MGSAVQSWCPQNQDWPWLVHDSPPSAPPSAPPLQASCSFTAFSPCFWPVHCFTLAKYIVKVRRERRRGGDGEPQRPALSDNEPRFVEAAFPAPRGLGRILACRNLLSAARLIHIYAQHLYEGAGKLASWRASSTHGYTSAQSG